MRLSFCMLRYSFYIFENKTARNSLTVQKMKFSIKDFFSKCDQIHRKLLIWLHLLKKSLMENFIFCAVHVSTYIRHSEDVLCTFSLRPVYRGYLMQWFHYGKTFFLKRFHDNNSLENWTIFKSNREFFFLFFLYF